MDEFRYIEEATAGNIFKIDDLKELKHEPLRDLQMKALVRKGVFY